MIIYDPITAELEDWLRSILSFACWYSPCVLLPRAQPTAGRSGFCPCFLSVGDWNMSEDDSAVKTLEVNAGLQTAQKFGNGLCSKSTLLGMPY